MLVTVDPAIAAEVASLEAEAEHQPAEVVGVLLSLGHALRGHCPLSLLLAAVEAALLRGWAATSGRLLPELAASVEEAAMLGRPEDAASVALASTMIFAALYSLKPSLVEEVLECGGGAYLLGGPATRNAAGDSALHLASRPLPPLYHPPECRAVQ